MLIRKHNDIRFLEFIKEEPMFGSAEQKFLQFNRAINIQILN